MFIWFCLLSRELSSVTQINHRYAMQLTMIGQIALKKPSFCTVISQSITVAGRKNQSIRVRAGLAYTREVQVQ